MRRHGFFFDVEPEVPLYDLVGWDLPGMRSKRRGRRRKRL